MTPLVSYINSIVFGPDRRDGVTIGKCYHMAAEKFSCTHDDAAQEYLAWWVPRIDAKPVGAA